MYAYTHKLARARANTYIQHRGDHLTVGELCGMHCETHSRQRAIASIERHLDA